MVYLIHTALTCCAEARRNAAPVGVTVAFRFEDTAREYARLLREVGAIAASARRDSR